MEPTTFDTVIWIIIIAYFYLLPSFIAIQKRSIMTIPILFLNLFLGWTLIVWLLCFVWACTANK